MFFTVGILIPSKQPEQLWPAEDSTAHHTEHAASATTEWILYQLRLEEPTFYHTPIFSFMNEGRTFWTAATGSSP